MEGTDLDHASRGGVVNRSLTGRLQSVLSSIALQTAVHRSTSITNSLAKSWLGKILASYRRSAFSQSSRSSNLSTAGHLIALRRAPSETVTSHCACIGAPR